MHIKAKLLVQNSSKITQDPQRKAVHGDEKVITCKMLSNEKKGAGEKWKTGDFVKVRGQQLQNGSEFGAVLRVWPS